MKIRVRVDPITLRRVLARRNKTQRWLAGFLGVSEQHIWYAMTGRRGFSPQLREKLWTWLRFHVGAWDEAFIMEEYTDGSVLP